MAWLCLVVAFLLLCTVQCSGEDSPSVPNHFYVEEVYSNRYIKLPLTVDVARVGNWTVFDECVKGKGRLAEHVRWGNTFRLWFDALGYVIGFQSNIVSTKDLTTDLWKRESSKSNFYSTNVFFRESKGACLAENQEYTNYTLGFFLNRLVGDRLYVENVDLNMPLTWASAEKREWNNTTPCVPNMGIRYYSPNVIDSSEGLIGSVFNHDGHLTSILLSLYAPQLPPFEPFPYVENKHNQTIYSLHVYFRNWTGSCEKPPLWWEDANADLTKFSVTGFQKFGKVFRGWHNNETKYFVASESALKQFYESPDIRREGCDANITLLATIWGNYYNESRLGRCPFTIGLSQLNGSPHAFRKSMVTSAFNEAFDAVFSKFRSETYSRVLALRELDYPWDFIQQAGDLVIPAFVSALFGMDESEVYSRLVDDMNLHYEVINFPYFEFRDYNETAKNLSEAHVRIYNFLDKVLAKHESQKLQDFVGVYLDKPGIAILPRDEKLVDLYSVLHGAEKLARSLPHVFVAIARWKNAHDPLLEEVHGQRHEGIDEDSEDNLPETLEDMIDRYPHARRVVNEALRYWNHVQVVQAVTVNSIGIHDTPYQIPKNRKVMACLHASNQGEDGDKFLTSRWEDKEYGPHLALGFHNYTYGYTGVTHACAAESTARSILQLFAIEFMNVWQWALEEKIEVPLSQFFPARFYSEVPVISDNTQWSSGAVVGLALGLFIFFAVFISMLACVLHEDSVDGGYATL